MWHMLPTQMAAAVLATVLALHSLGGNPSVVVGADGAGERTCSEGDGSCITNGAASGDFTYLVGSGWHASVSGFHPLQKINARVDATVRTPSWFPLWYEHLLHSLTGDPAPAQVVVADAHSPAKPPHVGTAAQDRHYPGLQWVELTRNFGHEGVSAAPTVGGWERSVLQGAFQAILNDVDYFVYVEQDLLVRGRGWMARCVAALRAGKDRISYGAATQPASTVGFGSQPLQQSLVVVSRAYLPTFVRKLLRSKADIEAAAPGSVRPSAERRWHAAFGDDVDLLPFGTGRTRPIPDGEFAYAQQMSRDEITAFLMHSGLPGLLDRTSAGASVNNGVPEVQITLNLGAGQAGYIVPAGLHEEAFAQMLCLQVMQQQLKRPELQWADVERAEQMLTCVSGVAGLARTKRDKVLQLAARQTAAVAPSSASSSSLSLWEAELFPAAAAADGGYVADLSLACDPQSGSCACAAAWHGGHRGVMPSLAASAPTPTGAAAAATLARCFAPAEAEENVTRLTVEPGSWVAKELTMGRYACARTTCFVSSAAVTSPGDTDVYVGVSRRHRPPRVPAALRPAGASSPSAAAQEVPVPASAAAKAVTVVVLDLENPVGADVAPLCAAGDVVVGYRDFCAGHRGGGGGSGSGSAGGEAARAVAAGGAGGAEPATTRPTFLPVSYVSDPSEAFRLPPLDRAAKGIAAFSMVKNCGAGARNAKMQSVVAALAAEGIRVDHFGLCTFGQPPPHVGLAAEAIHRGVCGPYAGHVVDPNHNPEKDCLLRHSRFHLAFENSRDEGYVTEKLWGALKMGAVPVVWGDAGARVRPLLPAPEAAIFADDFASDAALAQYLARVDKNATLYARHLAWKTAPAAFQPGFEALVARGLERMFCQVCDHHHLHHRAGS